MFDKNKRKEFNEVTIGDILAYLQKLPKNAKVLFNGDTNGYIHVMQDESAISFDDNSLEYLYNYYEDKEAD